MPTCKYLGLGCKVTDLALGPGLFGKLCGR